MTFPAAAEPLVIRVIREHKARLLAREADTLREMASRWLQVEQRLEAQISALAFELDQERRAGRMISSAKLSRMSRYRSLLRQAREETGRYAEYADDLISKRQAEVLVQAIDDGVQAIQAGSGSLVGAYFDRLPVEAVEGMIGLAGDGSPLKRYLRQIYPDAIDGITRALVQGTALGRHPVQLAREMASGFSMGLQTALNTARTETLRVYRQVSLEQYRASGVVEGYLRLSARDQRVCAGCLMADDGTVYPLDQPFEEHNQGRCTPVPVLVGKPKPVWESGAAWFERQDEETQRLVLGKGHFQAWKDGAFELPDLVTHQYDPVWGGAIVPTPLRELVGRG